MKKRIAALISAALLLCSCRQTPELTEKPVANGSFGGIAFDTSFRTVGSALPVPEAVPEQTEESAEASDISESEAPADVPEETEASETTAVTASSAKNTAAATTAVSTAATTAATTTTTTTTTTTAVTTTTKTTTITTTAATTTTTAAAAPASSGSYPKNSYKALNYDEMKGVWISYIEIAGLLRGKSGTDFRKAAGEIYDNCVSIGLNTVYVHARAFGDAFYYSELFPFTKHISNSLGTRTDYDPMKILIEEAHKRKLSFHAWINPLRLCSAADMDATGAGFPVKKWYSGSEKGKYIVNVDGTWFLNPAYDETVKLVGDGVREIVSGYDVDGVHIDDYFYPTTDASFDSAAYAASGYSSLSSFRIDRCNKMVKEIYGAVHECSGSAVFGASTQGNMDNNLYQLYADASAWCKGGYVDYFAPQIYYGFDNSAQPFKKCTDEWNELVSGTKTKLCVGLSVYKVGQEDKWAGGGQHEWQNSDTMLKRQIEYARSCAHYGGIALYCYNYLFTGGYVTPAIQKEMSNFKPLLTG